MMNEFQMKRSDIKVIRNTKGAEMGLINNLVEQIVTTDLQYHRKPFASYSSSYLGHHPILTNS